MFKSVVLGILATLALANPCHARVRMLLFPPGTSQLEAMRQIGFNERAFFRAQYRCKGDAIYPCKRRPVDGQFIGHGIPDGNGSCLLPTMYIFAGRHEFSVSITINANCDMRFHNFGPSLSFPDDPGDFKPQTISFPDPDGESPGIFPQPLVTVGQQITRRAWVKAKTKKFIPPYESPTRDLALVDYREKIFVKTINPVIDWVRYENFAKINLNYPWERTAYQPLPGNPAPTGPFTHANTTVASFRNRNTNASHTLIAQVRVGPKAAFSGGCQNSGSFPTDSGIYCEQRFSVLDGPRPL